MSNEGNSWSHDSVAGPGKGTMRLIPPVLMECIRRGLPVGSHPCRQSAWGFFSDDASSTPTVVWVFGSWWDGSPCDVTWYPTLHFGFIKVAGTTIEVDAQGMRSVHDTAARSVSVIRPLKRPES